MPMARLASTLLCCSVPWFSSYADDKPPVMAYTAPDSELMQLDNGVILEGSDLQSLDNYSSGFRVTAGFSPGGSLNSILALKSPIGKAKKSPPRPVLIRSLWIR
ncbi:hypothetical protein HSBAA_26300 [Vreelandella sulfidaeris]|uniref:Uncharacterized protein n=1 Tax=Vreelandella sulfidaeris TaxID=115553 RepID=A0A455UDV2_9GAMM|nr:hypothetical protein HSBAA_26300 [Halomonas sulfidaeris]